MADVGRPTKLTPETVNKLEQVFAMDGTVEEACSYADISRTLYYQWIKENPELLDRFDSLRERPMLKARQTIVKSLDDPHHAFKYAEKKRKREFGQTVDITSDGEKVGAINYITPNESDHNKTNS
jgi:hypothetical protein